MHVRLEPERQGTSDRDSSDFVRNQLLSITNCMNGGYPRWQSQYLRKLVMPDVKSIGEELSSRMLDALSYFI